MTKTEDLRKTDKKELEKKVLELKKRLSDTRFKFAANQMKNVKEAGNTRKEIARIMTVLQETKTKKQ